MKMIKTFSVTLGVSCLLFLHGNQVSAEWFLNLYAGGQFSGDYGESPPSTSLKQSLKENPGGSFEVGGRVGRWFEDTPWLGLALDASYYEPDINDAEIYMAPISALLLLRLRLVPDEEFPEGALEPYFGIGPALFFSKIELDLKDLGILSTYQDTSTDLGLDTRLGFLVHFTTQWGVHVEFRFTYVEPSYTDTIQGVSADFEPEFKTYHGLLGMTYRF
jgi:hypothetical protein